MYTNSVIDDSVILRPTRHRNIEVFENAAILYTLGEDNMTYLNKTAFLVYSLCQGNEKLKDLVNLLQSAYPDEHQCIVVEAYKAATELIERGILRVYHD
ncbi:PqqD family protein [Desulforhopalus singaporensis]|uniref:Coenzyme PQQ synthesis protein D (PqqD) n=1 Tax=Desulforhopalus singaporensis TaxID=91360 RepID=A0A1H0VK21_9BACT|nr:PqqD family protein [Desulforhopalus singaporensis]SDP78674.1 Coenzyme PQQ synthesis protein D (PqqD) [Desulforhopalus singaporensis]